MNRHLSQRGYTLSQLLVALGIVAMMLLISVPAFSNILAKSRCAAASRGLIGDLLQARSQAVATGWQCKIIGFGGTSTVAQKNQYRLLARQNTGVAWPSDTAASARTATTWAEPWVNITTGYPGVTLDPGGSSAQDRFEAMFDSRGAATTSTNDFAPFRVLGKKDAINVTISAAGGVTTAAGTFP